jgi:hypothetical protein
MNQELDDFVSMIFDQGETAKAYCKLWKHHLGALLTHFYNMAAHGV